MCIYNVYKENKIETHMYARKKWGIMNILKVWDIKRK